VIEENEVVVLLKALPFIVEDSIMIYNANYSWIEHDDQTEIIYQCSISPGKYCGGLVFSNGIVTSIWMNIHYSHTFSQVVSELGNPDYYSCFELPGEIAGRKLSLYWVEKGIIAHNNRRTSCSRIDQKSGVSPELDVTSIEYITLGYFDYLIGQDIVQSWPGFSD
jgi:hypothetical protein